MAYSKVLSVVLLLVIVSAKTFAVSDASEVETKIRVITVNDVSELKNYRKGPELMVMQQSRSGSGTIRYTLGERKSGDKLVARTENSYSWEAPTNVQARLQYPIEGKGALITYVELLINNGMAQRAYVQSGGIGQREIVVIIEAINTSEFKLSSRIYGNE